jgi:PAT family beta-lactamase induction signal transducer AmpG
MTKENVGLSIYFDNRMLRILLLGAISGFPWVIIGSALSLWLKDYELSRSTIGWAGLIFSVYAINFIWAPIIDRVKIPILTQKIGHRKSWIISLQAIILVCLFIWTTLNPITNLELIILLGLLIAISSASQDITIDALRIEQIGENEKASMAAGASIAVVGWWTGYKIGGMLTLFVADYFEQQGLANYWQLTFLFICLIIFLFNIGLLFIPEDLSNKRHVAQKSDQDLYSFKLNNFRGALLYFISPILFIFTWFVSTIVSPLISFFKKNGLTISLLIIGFIFLFKIGEAFLGRMSIIFYDEMGFSKSDIAIYSKGLGWITTIVFTLLGGWFSIKSGVVRALFISGIAMAITNIMFSVMAWSEKSVLLFAAAVLLDDLAAAFATVAFVTFISLLVDRTYTATQYALLASLGTAGRTLMASSSGSLVDWLQGDWGVFFIITAVMVIPSLILLWFIRNKFSFN